MTLCSVTTTRSAQAKKGLFLGLPVDLPAEGAAVETVLLVPHSKCSCPLLVLLLGQAVLTRVLPGLAGPKARDLDLILPRNFLLPLFQTKPGKLEFLRK